MGVFDRFKPSQGAADADMADDVPLMTGEPATLADAARQSHAHEQEFRARENRAKTAAENEGLPSVNRKRNANKLVNILGLVAILVFGAAMIVVVNAKKGSAQQKKTTTTPEKVANNLPPLVVPAAPPPLAVPQTPATTPGAQVPPIASGTPGSQPIPLKPGQPPRGADGKPVLDWTDRKMTGMVVVGHQSAAMANQGGYGGGGFDNGAAPVDSPARPGVVPAVNRTAPYANGNAAAARLASVNGGASGAGATPDGAGQAGPMVMPGAGSGGGGNGELAVKLEPTVTKAVSAALLPDRNFLITKGAKLDCVLETALDSSLPGMTTCQLARDVYSDNGQVLLLEKGTQLVGEYQGGIKRGQRRLFVLWSRAKTPNGVVVNLNSPGTDALGRSGLEGWVDNHFLERFGAAILMSFVSDSVAAALKNDNSGVTNYYGNTASSGSKVVEKMLESSANIPSTLVKNQGDAIQVIVARDLDFSSVYGLTLKR